MIHRDTSLLMILCDDIIARDNDITGDKNK
jgi:hypothetical protein